MLTPLCRACGCQTEQAPDRDGYQCASPVCSWFVSGIALFSRSLRRRWREWLRWREGTTT